MLALSAMMAAPSEISDVSLASIANRKSCNHARPANIVTLTTTMLHGVIIVHTVVTEKPWVVDILIAATSATWDGIIRKLVPTLNLIVFDVPRVDLQTNQA